MSRDAPEWCSCGDHLVDSANHRPLCPSCLDRAAKDAEAKVVALGWRVFGSGGATI